MEEIALFFGQDDAVGFELPADARHHLADAMYGVRLVHAEADGVVDGSLLEQHFIDADVSRQVVVEIQAGAVVAVLAVPGDQRVVQQEVHAGDRIVEDARDETIAAQLRQAAVAARRRNAREQLVALPARQRLVLRDAELLAHVRVAVEEFVRFGVRDDDPELGVIECLAVEDEAVARVDGLAVLLFFRLVHALDQELQEAVEAAALRAAHRSVVHVERAGAAVDALDGMDGIGNLDIRFLQGGDEGGLLEQQETTATDMRDRDGLRQHRSQDRTDLLQEMRAEFLAVCQADGIEFRHIDERRRVIVAVEAEVIGIAKPYHDHAAVVEKARLFVGDGGAHIAHLFVLFHVDIVQDGDEARNPVVPVERELLGARRCGIWPMTRWR